MYVRCDIQPTDQQPRTIDAARSMRLCSYNYPIVNQEAHMKKNPGRKERRRQARINRREAGRERAKANELAQKKAARARRSGGANADAR